MTPPVPKTQKSTAPLVPPTLAAPAPAPAPARRGVGWCPCLSYAFLVFSVSVSMFANYTWFVSHDCTKAEEVLQKICDPELERVRLITETTIPDFAMSPIAMDVAKKCDNIQECLSPVKCVRLRSLFPLPARCGIFYFFNIRFAQCRLKLVNEYAKESKCVETFFGPGPLQCHLLNEHVDCVQELVTKECAGAGLDVEFANFVDEYRAIIECPKIGEEESAAVDDDGVELLELPEPEDVKEVIDAPDNE